MQTFLFKPTRTVPVEAVTPAPVPAKRNSGKRKTSTPAITFGEGKKQKRKTRDSRKSR